MKVSVSLCERVCIVNVCTRTGKVQYEETNVKFD